jgi:hypothetical protein
MAHFDLEATTDQVTATMHAYGLTQSWTHVRSHPGAIVRLRLDAVPPPPVMFAGGSCDLLHAAVLDDDWVELAAVDGRFLSSEVCGVVGAVRDERRWR